MTRRKRRCGLALLALAALPAIAAGATPVRGGDAPPKIELRGDLSITTDDDRGTLTVASFEHDFVIFLPYTGPWTLESEKNTVLTGRSGRYTVAVVRRAVEDDDPRELLERSLDELLIDDADIRFLQFVERRDRVVLGFQVRYAETGPWHWFYWLLFPAKKGWWQLNVVDANPGELVPLDIDLVDLMSRSTTVSEVMGRAD